MLLLILLAILAIILFGVGFTVHWLFILAIIAALLFVIMFFVGGAGGRSRRAWW
ncbi:MAG: hydrophobic protein [Gaiellaceae bacterium]